MTTRIVHVAVASVVLAACSTSGFNDAGNREAAHTSAPIPKEWRNECARDSDEIHCGRSVFSFSYSPANSCLTLVTAIKKSGSMHHCVHNSKGSDVYGRVGKRIVAGIQKEALTMPYEEVVLTIYPTPGATRSRLRLPRVLSFYGADADKVQELVRIRLRLPLPTPMEEQCDAKHEKSVANMNFDR